jgi:hypothetical protein
MFDISPIDIVVPADALVKAFLPGSLRAAEVAALDPRE